MSAGESVAALVDSDRKRYERLIRRRLRRSDLEGALRAGGVQVVWLVIVMAGAAIPLSEALIGNGWEWVSPVLGFVIVVAAGVERIFSKTSVAAAAVDELRRDLARQRRQLLAGCGPYADQPDGFAVYAERTEGAISRFDAQMIEYNRRLLEGSA